MKRKMVISLLIFCIPSLLMAIPPFLWYGTYSVENYAGNGCSGMNLTTCHEDAVGFAAALQARSLPNASYRINKRDAACTAAVMRGASAEINYLDFIFYAGHGDGSGPYLGCSAAYTLDSWTDLKLGQNGYLKWVQGAACQWFADSYAGMTKWARWNAAFQGVHVVQAHKAVTYDHNYSNQMSAEFWDRWITAGNGISTAWMEAQIRWVYTATGYPGLCPAVLAPDNNYAQETWAAAGDEKAPAGCNVFLYKVVGSPEY